MHISAMPIVAMILAPYLSARLPMKGARTLLRIYPGTMRRAASSGLSPLTPWRYRVMRKARERYPIDWKNEARIEERSTLCLNVLMWMMGAADLLSHHRKAGIRIAPDAIRARFIVVVPTPTKSMRP